jgi:phosphocarrier protein HPr
MRPAMQFVDLSNTFHSAISVNNGQVTVDGKSIMQISTLMATCGTRLKIRAEGDDAAQAVEALRELVEVKKFGEPTPEEVEKEAGR